MQCIAGYRLEAFRMDSQIAKLVELQQLDGKVAHLAAFVAGVPARIAALERTLDEQKRAVEAAEKAATQEEAKRRRLESDLKDQQQKAVKFRDQASGVKTNEQFRALQNEIGFVEAEVHRVEDRILASMIESDSLRMRRSEAQGELANHKKRLDGERAEIEVSAAEMRREIDGLNEKRTVLRGSLDQGMLGEYDRLAGSHRKTALARVTESRCTACQMSLRPQYWNEVRSGALRNCESCGRLLYFDPELEPGRGDGPGAWTA